MLISTRWIGGRIRLGLEFDFFLSYIDSSVLVRILIVDFFSSSFIFLQPLADAEGAKKGVMIELIRSNGGLSFVRLIFVLRECFFSS